MEKKFNCIYFFFKICVAYNLNGVCGLEVRCLLLDNRLKKSVIIHRNETWEILVIQQ